jgi:hypothetical protein
MTLREEIGKHPNNQKFSNAFSLSTVSHNIERPNTLYISTSHEAAANMCCVPHVPSYKLREQYQAKSDYEIHKIVSIIAGWISCNGPRGSHASNWAVS